MRPADWFDTGSEPEVPWHPRSTTPNAPWQGYKVQATFTRSRNSSSERGYKKDTVEKICRGNALGLLKRYWR
jgi:hypothetical protein